MAEKSNSVTPMMAQFLEIKGRYKDALLFYRMGDFYEMFFDDAVAAADALDISLTKRGKHLGQDIPMCGVPAHSSESYLLSLIKQGFRVAICEQLENPAEAKKRGTKSVVNRDVVRLVTPGTLTEDTLLDAKSNNFLAAYSEIRDQGALAWVDISTGEFHVSACQRVTLLPSISRLQPSELLVMDTNLADFDYLVDEENLSVTTLASSSFDSNAAENKVKNHFSVSSLDGFGNFSRSELSALGAIINYLSLTQKNQMPILRAPTRENASAVMQIDTATRRSLEITQTLSGTRAGSLLSTIDRTITASGARLLERRLASPLINVEPLKQRLADVDYFVQNTQKRDTVRATLRLVPDMERALSRLSIHRGGPRDIGSLRNGLTNARHITGLLDSEIAEPLDVALRDLDDLSRSLDECLVAEPTLAVSDGNFVLTGYAPELDEARQLRDEGRTVIAQLQSDYGSLCEIQALKIKHNRVLGYFIETPSGHANKMLAEPLSETFIHRQTTANAIRFTTVELSNLETKILNAGAFAQEIETRIFEELRIAIIACANALNDVALALSRLDVTAAMADLAIGRNWIKPVLDDSRAFAIEGGRHPVVEAALHKKDGTVFVTNDCDLSSDTDTKIWLLTGPNMAGKSTFLRQNAIIAILAQIGSYVPARSAHIGIVSQLFSRVGASDDLARGRSTFMVEMIETAAILNQADDRALVILDEIGRGTATYDGLSIAWATLEHLHMVNKCRCLFATHYHELTSLAKKLPGVQNATVVVKEWEGDIIFLHEVRQGAADRSYGVQVAKLAGLPIAVTDRARLILDQLEDSDLERRRTQPQLIDDLPLFSTKPEPKPQVSVVEERVKDLNPDTLTPREALQYLYDLKDLTRGR